MDLFAELPQGGFAKQNLSSNEGSGHFQLILEKKGTHGTLSLL